MKRKVLSILLTLVLVLSFSLVTAVPAAVSAAGPAYFEGDTIAVTSHDPPFTEQDATAFAAEPHTTVVDGEAFDAQTCSQVVIEGEVSGLNLGAGWLDTAYVEIGLRPEATMDERNAGVYLIAFNLPAEGGTRIHLQDYTGSGQSGGLIDLPDKNTDFRYKITLEPSVEFGGSADLQVTVGGTTYGPVTLAYGYHGTWDESYVPETLTEDFSDAHLFYSIIAECRGAANQTYNATVGAITIDDTLYVGTGQQFATIQAAINFANPGDTINVAAGTYNQVVEVISGAPGVTTVAWVNKPLTLKGANAGIPGTGARGAESIVDADDPDDAHWRPGFYVTSGDVIIDGFHIIDTDEAIHVRAAGYGPTTSGDRKNVVIKNNFINTTEGNPDVGIAATGIIFYNALYWTDQYYSVDGAVVQDNYIYQAHGRNSIWFQDVTGSITIKGNEIDATTSGDGIYLGGTAAGVTYFGTPIDSYIDISGTVIEDNELQMGGGIGIQLKRATTSSSLVSVTGNNITGAEMGVRLWSVDSEIVVQGNEITNGDRGIELGRGGAAYTVNNVSILSNDILDNNIGICIRYDGDLGTGNEAHFNNIVGNSQFGVKNQDTTAVFDATKNWWNDASGPQHATTNPSGTGDPVSDNVKYSPWCAAADDEPAIAGYQSPAPMTWGVSTNGNIQEAINDSAIADDTIIVAAGAYELSDTIYIDKPLSLLGPNVGINPNTEIRVDEAVLTPGEGWEYAGISIGYFEDVSDVIIDGFKFDGFTEPVSRSGRTIDITYGTNIVSDITITNNWITNGGHGVYSAKGVSKLFVTDNKFTSLTTDLGGSDLWSAVYVFHSSGGEISGNVIDGTRSSGILLWDDANFVVSGNAISNTPNAGILVIGPMDDLVIEDNIIDATATDETVDLGPDGIYELGGITLIDQSGYGDPFTAFTGTVTVTGNTVTNSFNGLSTICIGLGTSLADWSHVNYNNFYDGVTHSGVGTLDALYNWWGDETGPEHATLNPGAQGDSVSDNVLFSPWLYKTQEAIVDTKEPAYAQSVVLDNAGPYGWNTFSVPIVLDDTADTWAKLINLTDLDLSIAYRFDSATQKFVLLTDTDASPINPGEGFFIKMNTAGSLPILYSTADNLTPPSRPLTVGWNLIGLANLEDMEASVALFSLAGEGQVVSPSGNESPGAVLTGHTVYVGEAYWVYMLGERTLVGFTTTPVNWVP